MNTEMSVVVTGILYDENNNIKQKIKGGLKSLFLSE